MGFHGGGWFAYLRHDEKQDKLTLSRPLLRRVAAFAKPYARQTVFLLLTVALISGLTVVSPYLYLKLIDEALPNKDFRLLTLLTLGMVAVPLISGLMGVVQRNLGAAVGEGIIQDLRVALYAHMQKMSLRFFTNTRTGELMSRLNNDVIGAQRALTSTLLSIVANVFAVVATLIAMSRLDWKMTLISLLIVPIFIVSARRVGRRLRKLRKKSMVFSAELNAGMNETLNVSGALLVKLFGREQHETDKFADNAANVRDIGIKSAVVTRWFMLVLSLASALGTAFVFWYGGMLVLRGDGVFTIGMVVAFGAYLRQLYGPLMALSNAPVEFVQSMVSFERVFEVLDIPIEIEESANAVVLNDVQGRIEFENVSFAYAGDGKDGLDEVARFSWNGSAAHLKRGVKKEDDASDTDEMEKEDKPSYAVRGLNFVIEPGQLVALVGPSGAGKTTVTYLIPRLYDPSRGRITLDGHDLREVSAETISSVIGMVTQETYLFYDTIRANLMYARQNATEQEMIAAAKAANIDPFIQELPDKYDTVVGERGYRLSGGERQRIAIARVLLKDPRILVLDEATSSLDSISEALIQDALGHIMKTRTSLVIAHRLSTVLSADKILVLEKGQIIESGTHEQLVKENGLYASIYRTQFMTSNKEKS